MKVLELMDTLSDSFQRDIKRVTQLHRKINPGNWDYQKLDYQNVWLQWAFLKEDFDISLTKTDTRNEIQLEILEDKILQKGSKPIHFIDHQTFENSSMNFINTQLCSYQLI